jgi:hypothetical protein
MPVWVWFIGMYAACPLRKIGALARLYIGEMRIPKYKNSLDSRGERRYIPPICPN